MMRLLATATAATALLFSPTPGVLVLSPALTDGSLGDMFFF